MSAGTAGLVEPFKSAVEALVAASGGKVTVASGRRTNAEQRALRAAHGCGGNRVMDSSCKGQPVTAIPGTSRHESGQAVDFGGDLALAARLAPQFGLVRTVPSEAWHYELAGARASSAPPAGHRAVGGVPNPIDVVGGVVGGVGDAAGSIASFFELLVDPHFWLRVLMVAGGFFLVGVGVGLLTTDSAGADLTPAAIGSAAA